MVHSVQQFILENFCHFFRHFVKLQIFIAMSVQDYGSSLRSQCIGMLKAGKSTNNAAQELDVSIRSVQRWWRSDKLGFSEESKPKSGRSAKINRVCKIIIAKSLAKRRQSTRKLAAKLNKGGCKVSHTTVHRYFRNFLGVTPYKRPKDVRHNFYARWSTSSHGKIDSKLVSTKPTKILGET